MILVRLPSSEVGKMPSSNTHVCATCSDNFIVNSKLIVCKYCNNKHHLQCVRIKDMMLKTINECKNLYWFCDDCVAEINSKLDISKKLQTMEQKLEECKNNTEQILIGRYGSQIETERNWANVVKQNIHPPLIIRPKNINQDSATTKSVVEQKIKPSEVSAAVNKVKTIGQGSVIIECNDPESLKKLENKAISELSSNYNVEILKPMNPKIIVVGVKDKYVATEERFIETVKKQNCLDNVGSKDIKFIKKYVSKKSHLHNIILEVTPEIFKCLISCKKLFCDWDSFPIYEYIGVLRCYKCWNYGHRAAHCRKERVVCPLCNENHKSEDCKSDSKECTNCKYAFDVLKLRGITYDHTVFDKCCVSYQKAVGRMKNRTNYI